MDDLDRIDHEARQVARQLRNLTRQLTDAPERERWWKLRKRLRGTTRWRQPIERATSKAPRDHPIWIALADLDGAIHQARKAIRELGAGYDTRAGYGVGSRARPNPDAPDISRVFTARFDGTCTACGQRLHRGEPARYDDANKIRHDRCPTPADQHRGDDTDG